MRQTTGSMTIKGKIPLAQLTAGAMRQAGIDPELVAIKPGTRVHTNRKAQAKRGYSKHKSCFRD